MQFRAAEYGDYPAIACLHAKSWQGHYQGILSDDYLDHCVLEDKQVAEGIWQAPCGSQIKEQILAWPTPAHLIKQA